MRFLTRIPWLLLLLLLIGVAWSIRPISDTDILWHLRTGQWMLAQGDVIRHDVFSATRLGCEWVSVPWLYEVMLAKLQAGLGWGGLTLWQVLMVAAITLQTAYLVWLLRRSNSSGAFPHRWNWKWPYLSVPAALAVWLTLRLLQMRINCRPELNSYLFLGTFLIILTVATKDSGFRIQDSEDNPASFSSPSTKSQEPRTKNAFFCLLWLLPLVQVLWTNTHGAFIFGPLLVWGYAAAAWLSWLVVRWLVARERPVDPDGFAPLTEGEWPRHLIEPPPVRLTIAAALTTLVCLVTPYGLAGTFYPFHLFHVLTDPLYKNGIVEAHPVDLSMTLESGSLGYALLTCWVLAGLGLLGRMMEGMQAINKVQGSGFRVQGFSIIGSWLRCITSTHQASNAEHQNLNPEPRTLETLNASSTHNLPLGYLFACAAMAYLSLSAIRNVPLLPLVVAPLVASGIEYAADGLAAVVALLVLTMKRICPSFFVLRFWLGRHDSSFRRQRSDVGSSSEEQGTGNQERGVVASRGVAMLHSRTAHIVAQALLALVLLFTYRKIVSERFYDALGWRMRFAIGYSDHEHPLAACDFVARHRSEISCRTLYGDTRSANLFLARFGPQWPIYFDGRHAEIYDAPSFRTAARTRFNPAIFDREAATYGIGLVCFSLTDLKEDRSPLAIALGQTNTWQLVYLDDCAALFVADHPTNAAFVARYGLPCAPTNATLQRSQFADWLQRQGRGSMADLHDPANQSLEEGVLAVGIVNTLQLGGLWAPTRHLEPLRFCRLASFVDHLGWTVVADDLYQQALRWPDSFPVTLPRAIRHALAVCKAVADPGLQTEMRNRVRLRALELQRIDPDNPLAAEALAEVRNRYCCSSMDRRR